MKVSVERVFITGEWEKGHRRWNGYVDSKHAGIDFFPELANRFDAVGVNARTVCKFGTGWRFESLHPNPRARTTDKTEAKISSVQIAIPCLTWSKIVGPIKYPSPLVAALRQPLRTSKTLFRRYNILMGPIFMRLKNRIENHRKEHAD